MVTSNNRKFLYLLGHQFSHRVANKSSVPTYLRLAKNDVKATRYARAMVMQNKSLQDSADPAGTVLILNQFLHAE